MTKNIKIEIITGCQSKSQINMKINIQEKNL